MRGVLPVPSVPIACCGGGGEATCGTNVLAAGMLASTATADSMTEPSLRAASTVEILAIEQSLRAAVPEAVFASSRVVRRVIRGDLDLPLLRARVPHRESIALSPARLLELADDVWALPAQLPDTILLVARPESDDGTHQGRQELLREYWRRLFHGCLDLAARRLLESEAIDGPDFQALIERIGETSCEEARAVLAQEGLLRDADDSKEMIAELIATILELAVFAPRLVPVWFPSVEDADDLVDFLDRLLDADAILARTRPEGLHEPGPPTPPAIRSRAAQPLSVAAPTRFAQRAMSFLRPRAFAAAHRGNDVRAALLLWRLRTRAAGDPATGKRAERQLASRIADLARRLDRAVGGVWATPQETAEVLGALVEAARGSAWSQPARLLYDLQKICVDSERESYRTQLLFWAFTLGRVPLIRPLPSQRAALVHRHMAAALRRLPAAGLAEPLASRALDILMQGMELTEASVRGRLGPPVRDALSTAGLVPKSLVEEAAFNKLVGELLDDIVERGFESFGSLRDAVSRSQVKLPDLAGVHELVVGDPLLRADRMLASCLDGAYRQAPAYLLAMQRLSSVAFGVPLGRAITLHLLLPFGGGWILWRGIEHIIELITHYSLGEPWHVSSRAAVLATGVGIWLLMHFPALRGGLLAMLEAIGGVLQLLCVTLPRRLLRLPAVERFLKSRPVRLFRQFIWSPLLATGVFWIVLPYGGSWLSRSNPSIPGILFLANAIVLNSPVGRTLQERLLEGLGRAVQQIHARLIVGLVTWIVDAFRRAIDFVEGTLYAVDEQLRFRDDESRVALAIKAVLTTLWSGIDWFVRFCVTLLIEPQLNPIKHFPVVTVSHKLLVPMIPMVAGNLAAATGMERRLALTTVTFFSTAIPGVFGFLAWELKENWRLYAANRPKTLSRVQVGRHGESMRRLLLPGFHSGTLPKLFTRLRRQLRGRRSAAGATRAEEQLVELASDITAFLDDEVLGLLRNTRSLADVAMSVDRVSLATNRVMIDLAADAVSTDPLRLELLQRGGTLVRRVRHPGWLAQVTVHRRQLVEFALSGLDCFCGVDFMMFEDGGRVESLPVEPIAWSDWRDAWQREGAANFEVLSGAIHRENRSSPT
jgi:hypothetical protein